MAQVDQTAWQEGLADRFYRHGTMPLASYLARLPWITPNRLSVTGFVIGGIGVGICILTHQPLWLSGLLFAAGDLLDYLDGDVARRQGTGSPEGAILDAVLDRYTDGLVLGALTWVTADAVLPIGLAAILGTMLTPYIRAKTEAEGKVSAPTLGDRGWRNRILILGLLVGQPVWTLAGIAVVANLAALHRLYIALRRSGT